MIPFDESDLGASVVIFEADAHRPSSRPRSAQLPGGDLRTSSFGRVSARRLRPMVCPTPRRSGMRTWTPSSTSSGRSSGLLQADRRRLRGSADRRFDLLFRSARPGIVQQARPFGGRAVCGADQHAQFRRTIGDASRLTLVTVIHLVALALIVAIALLALRDRRRADHDLPVRYPNWPCWPPPPEATSPSTSA